MNQLIQALFLIMFVAFIAKNYGEPKSQQQPLTSTTPVKSTKKPTSLFSNWLKKKFHFSDFTCQKELNQIIKSCDFKIVRADAVQLIKSENIGPFNEGMIADIFDFLIKNWEYVPDPTNYDYPFRASESFQLLRGDCDDFAALTASLIWAVGGHIRIVYAVSEKGGHAYAQVNLGKRHKDRVLKYLKSRYINTNGDFYYETDRNGNIWLNLDYSANHPGGPIFNNYYAIYLYPQNETCHYTDNP